jgi:toxin ParE1/3/4
MTYTVLLSTGVEEELEDAAMWIEEQREDYGIKLIDAFDEAIDHLSKYPLSYALKYRNLREIKLGRFSYILVFEVIGSIVLVVRLIHTSRYPATRYRRK